MGPDMKENSRKASSMVKVSTSFDWIESNIFFALIGKFFQVDGSRYEGEYKEGKKHGQGNNKF